jgi:N-acyl amino acid synthase of PEP-CTERM/exosortase system
MPHLSENRQAPSAVSTGATSPLVFRPRPGLDPAASSWFRLRVIDSASSLLAESFRLRYQVYCVERQFLPACDYPRGLEHDEFDNTSVHVGAIDPVGQLAGTARVVLPVGSILPTLTHCTSDLIAGSLWSGRSRWVEVSRLSVSRTYGRRADSIDSGFGHRGEVLLAVSKAVYLASKRLNATHWLVSMERSLARLLIRCGFPFHQVGPQFDYLGAVAPYAMDLAEFEGAARSDRYPQVAGFVASPYRDTQHSDASGFAVPPALSTVIKGLLAADA